MDQQSLKDILQITPNLRNQGENQEKTYPQQEPNMKIHKMRGPPKGSKRRPNIAVGIKTGLWNINEMKAYLKFITRFENHFQDKAIRKKKKIFHRMSNFIKSRTAQQCRSHHQKLELKFVTHDKIIEFIENQITNILKTIQQSLKEDDVRFQRQESPQIKMENASNSMECKMLQKQEQKKTQLRQAEQFYEITEARNVLIINIQEQNMQTWQ